MRDPWWERELCSQICVWDVCISILTFFYPVFICFLYFLVGQKVLRKLPHAKSPFKMPYELLMDVANNDPVPLLPTSLLPCPPSFKGIRGSRGVKLSESDLPCTCGPQWISDPLCASVFSYRKGNGGQFSASYCAQEPVFHFCLLLEPIWFPEQPSRLPAG